MGTEATAVLMVVADGRPLFSYNELEYFTFGLRLGIANLLENGLSLGLKKTVGKITQPINSYTRFPEYHFMAEAILPEVASCAVHRTKVLDVGSPKCFGLYLAYRFPLELHLTDISHANIDEYVQMWKPLTSKARGLASFALADARHLSYSDNSFDVVYSMSVVEHVDGREGDARSIREMIRVLKPNGLLVLSVPYGCRYVEQLALGLSEPRSESSAAFPQFFQRIYNEGELQRRVLASMADLKNIKITTVWRGLRPLAIRWGRRRDITRGVFGWLNPLLSCLVNRSQRGIVRDLPSSYGQVHNGRDIYGDVIVSGKRNV